MEQHEFDDLVVILEQKAQKGDAMAMKHLGDAYYQGATGKEKNTSAALPYWKKAVDNGEYSVAFKVGTAYFNGLGCKKDEITALRYYKLSADHGDIEGQFVTGLCHEHGFGCTVNTETAKYYYEKAALCGHGQAQWRLGCLQFVAKEHDAIHWMCCAHLSGIQDATDMINRLINDASDKEVFEYQIKLIQQHGVDPRSHNSSSNSESNSDGCYIATCVYGSYDCPQVWTLRRFRDYTLRKTWYGRAFISSYYAVSPVLVRWFGHAQWFQGMWRRVLDQLIGKLRADGISSVPYEDPKR